MVKRSQPPGRADGARCSGGVPAAGAVEMWESGAWGRISKPGGKGGKLAFFEFSRLSTGRHFHGAFHLVVLGAQGRGLLVPAALFAHRFASHLDAVGIVHQSVKNAVGQGRPGAPGCSCHLATGSWLVKIIDCI